MRFQSDRDYQDWLDLHNEPSYSERVAICPRCHGPIGEGSVSVRGQTWCSDCISRRKEDSIDQAMRGKRSYPETAA